MSASKAAPAPEGLSPEGLAAYKAVVTHLRSKKVPVTGIRFYSPSEWQERGETYGTESELVVVYESADERARMAFSMDACYQYARPGENAYARQEAMQAALGKAGGLYFQEATCWYGSVYKA